jgi:dihydrofolate reductase
MRKLIITEFTTLDGSIGAPMWSFPYWGDDIAAFKGEETQSTETDTLLLGRVTYEGFAQAWPGRPAEEGGAYFNGVEKRVVTSTLDTLEWENSHKLEGGLVDGVKALKESEGGNIVVHGSGTLARALIKEGLVDEIRLMVYPLTVGEGPRLFEDGMAAKYTLVEARPMASGAIGLVYAPAGE